MKSLQSQNFYEILGVSRYASPEEIRHAYELSKQTFTQDSMATYSLFSDEEQDEILEIVGLAYETLLNPQSRREYDTFLDSGEVGSHSAWMSWRRPRGEGGRDSAPGEGGGDKAPRGQPASAPRDQRAAAQSETPPTAQPPPATQRPAETQSAAARPPAGGNAQAGSLATAAPTNPDTPAAPAQPAPAGAENQIERLVDGVQQFNGSVLRQARELSGMSLRDVCDRTKIRQTYVEYIEAENFEGLPAPVYVKGFVRLLASALMLPPDRVVQDYMSRYEQRDNP